VRAQAKRETKLLSVLSYVSSTMWKSMFGKAAELERSTASEHEYMIVE
jgi:trafficking protein particle complex subunit 5